AAGTIDAKVGAMIRPVSLEALRGTSRSANAPLAGRSPAAGGTAAPALSLHGLRKSFGATEVIRGLDLEVERGGLTAVLGPSGCGKTTLLRLIAGFERLDAGEIVAGSRLFAGG